MYKHILIATDGSELASKALTHGLALAKAVGAKATIITVTEPWVANVSGEFAVAFPINEYDEACAANAQRILTPAGDAATKAGVAAVTQHVKDKFPAEGIIEAAKENDCDLVVMASHGRRGLSRMFLGSQASRVVTMSSVPVLICR